MQPGSVIWTVCDGEPLPIDPGAPRLLRTAILSEKLAERGHQVVYWSSRFDHFTKSDRLPTAQRLDSGHGYDIHCVDRVAYPSNVSPRRLLHNKVVRRSMERHMRADPVKPDVIVADLPTIELATLTTQLGVEWGVPVIVCVRDLWPDVFHSLLPSKLSSVGKLLFSGMERGARRALTQATGICGISQGYLDWGLHKAGRGVRQSDAIIPLGYPDRRPGTADAQKKALKTLEARGVDPRKHLISFVGTFGLSYDLATVVEAAKLLARDRDDVQFVLCGDGERAAEWKSMAVNLPSVCFPGWVERDEIAALLDKSAIGLAAYTASAHQGLPNKIFEYMSFGVPIVSTLAGEARTEIAQAKCGEYYRAGAPEQLAKTLGDLLDQPDRLQAMGQAGRARFLEKYQQSKVYDDYVSYVERTIKTAFANRVQTH